MIKFQNSVNTQQTPQSQLVMGRESEMHINEAGGAVFNIDDRSFLLRFLLTGAGAGSCNVGSPPDVAASIGRLNKMIETNGVEIIRLTAEFSSAGRGHTNDPALYVLALCLSSNNSEVRTLAMSQNILCQIVRIGTHLFNLMEYLKSLRGFGSGLCRAISRWYTSKDADDVAYQLLKYRQRNGWTHRDVMRKVHPRTTSSGMMDLFSYACDTRRTPNKILNAKRESHHVRNYEFFQGNPPIKDVISHLQANPNIPWEFLPTELHSNPDIWKALLPSMGAMALLRNLNRLTSLGVIMNGGGEATQLVVDKFSDQEFITRSRLHPFSILNAYSVYSSGSAVRGNTVWNPAREIVDVLENAFYQSFGNVQATNKRLMVSLDVSGSMDMHHLGSNPNLTARIAAMAMAMVNVSVESDCRVNAFSDQFYDVEVSPIQTIAENVSKINSLPFARTDCALPMLHAMNNGLEIDAFIIYTDNETWYGQIHPYQALKQYRAKSGINAKLISVAMSGRSSGTVADPRDPNMLDILGFDTATPNLISEFINL